MTGFRHSLDPVIRWRGVLRRSSISDTIDPHEEATSLRGRREADDDSKFSSLPTRGMSLSNYLTLKPQLAEFRSGSDRDTMSEISDSGTGGSMNSAMGSVEEIQKVAQILNISADEVEQDRFRVDRRKLELMLAIDGNGEEESAVKFFERVMEETSTVISWPSRLKVGAKSKKDPHVRVAGKLESIRMARDKIMQMLDTRGNRVTMKLDLSYTDHSHIIGKGGLTIKRVMEETGCHIHFPDSNRSNPMEKSNQVSIAGDMENVERARAKVRALTPLIFSFELPIMSSSQQMPDANSPYVIQVQEKYNVQVMFRTRPKLHATLVVVKGQQWEVQSTMEATTLLINYMCGNLASQTLVQMSLEITPMHHTVVLGRAATQLKIIMSNTKAQIMFPDAGDPNIPMLKKSNVTITGNIKDVYLARQQLIGSLPLVIMFDLPEEIKDVQTEQINDLMQNLNVFINIRHKPKLSALSVIIKGIERNAGDIYEARRYLLNLKEPTITPCIPESYHIPILPGCEQIPYFNPFSPTHQNNLPTQSPINVASTLQNLADNQRRNYSLPPLRLNDIPCFHNLNSPQYNPSTPGGYSTIASPSSISPSMYNPSWGLIPPSPQNQPTESAFQYPSPVFPTNGHQNVWGSPAMQQGQIPNMLSHIQHSIGNNNHYSGESQNTELLQPGSNSNSQPNSLGIFNGSNPGSSGYHSNFTGSSVSLDVHSVTGGDSNSGSNFVSPSISPISKTHSPAPSTCNDNPTNNDLINMISGISVGDRRAPGFEKKALETIQQTLTPLRDYQQMKMKASKAVKEPYLTEDYRVPTNRWAGYGFSQTSPNLLLSPNSAQHNNGNMPWSNENNSPITRPNIALSPSTTEKSKYSENLVCNYQKLSQLLSEQGLDKYIQLFQSHEVDIATFLSLTDGDLFEIGVTAFGARKKMLLAIAEFRKRLGSDQKIS